MLAACALAACGAASEDARGPLVLAPASMQGALEEVADDWAAQGHARPVLSFSATPALARQVEQGAPADLVMTADAQWMDWLEERRLLREGTRRDVIGNALVYVWSDPELVVPGTLREFGNPPRSLAIAEPSSVPAGRYAKQALMDAGLWEGVDDIILPAENVRARACSG